MKMTKMICAVMAAAVMVLQCASAVVLADTQDGFTYEITTDGAAITKYTGTAQSVTVPETLGGEEVTSIGDYAFSDTAVISVSLTSAVSDIGMGAFAGCKSLSQITLPDTVETIRYEAFRGCSALESIALPKNLEALSDDVFYLCTALKSVELPAALCELGDNVFGGCTVLADITVAAGNKNFLSVSGVLYSYDMARLIRCPAGTVLSSVAVSAKVKEICAGAFEDCVSVNAVYTAGAEKIGESAFYGCTSLESVLFSDTLTVISQKAFGGCTALEYAVIPPSAANISTDIFLGCDGWLVIIGTKGTAAEELADRLNVTFIDIAASGESSALNCAAIEQMVTLMPVKISTGDIYAVTAVNALVNMLPSDEKAEFTMTDRVNNLTEQAEKLIETVITGDVNGDSSVSSADALLVLQHSVKKTVLTGAGAKAADVNFDDAIDTGDALRILQYTVGKTTDFN